MKSDYTDVAFCRRFPIYEAGNVVIKTSYRKENERRYDDPYEAGALRATWQHSNDTSAVWAAAIQTSTDPMFVAPGAIPWFLLQVLGDQEGPGGGDKLTRTLYIQRVHTSGGVMPAAGCAASTDIGKKALVPYEADYVFYKQRGHGDSD
jgi:hypothetical protein